MHANIIRINRANYIDDMGYMRKHLTTLWMSFIFTNMHGHYHELSFIFKNVLSHWPTGTYIFVLGQYKTWIHSQSHPRIKLKEPQTVPSHLDPIFSNNNVSRWRLLEEFRIELRISSGSWYLIRTKPNKKNQARSKFDL